MKKPKLSRNTYQVHFATQTVFFVILFIVLSSSILNSQPYIYFSKDVSDSNIGHLEKIVRWNLSLNSVEDFLPQQTIGKYATPTSDVSQSFVIIEVYKLGYILYDCSNTSLKFDLNEIRGEPLNEILYSSQRNKLYIFSDYYKKIREFEVASWEITSELNLGKTAYPNLLMQPTRCSFFSSDNTKIYFFNVDSNDVDQLWTYSLKTNQIARKQNLLEIGGHSGSLGYRLVFGRNGKGIVQSYPVFYGNPDQDFYYKLYDFDTDTSSPFIYHYGECEAYFSGDGEYILIFETYLDTLNNSLSYYHTGEVEIYNPGNGELVKTLTFPSYGIVYTFDNYPDDIYYVIDIEEPTRQIFTLKMDSIFNVTKKP
jgi:hypothetical protein